MALPPETFTAFNGFCAAIATACAVYVAFRDARWRSSGLAKQLSDRVAAAQLAADRWHETTPARELRANVDRQGREIQDLSGRAAALATKADIQDVKVEQARISQEVAGAAAGIDRIEGLLLRRALGANGPAA